MSHREDEDNTDDAKNAVREEEVLNEGTGVPETEEKARQIGNDEEIRVPHAMKILAKRWSILSQADSVEAACLVRPKRDTSGLSKVCT